MCYNLCIKNREINQYNNSIINIRNKSVQFYSLKEAILLISLYIYTVENIIENEAKLKIFKEASTNNIVYKCSKRNNV